jgi:hypothetical protein
MARQCRVCFSPNLLAFEAAVASGQTVRDAADALGLSYDSAKRHVRNAHVQRPVPASVAPSAPEGPVETFRRAFRSDPMPHQVRYLTEEADTLVLKGRQVGISTAGGALAISTALSRPNVLVAIVSPSMKQSQEVTVKCRMGLVAIGATMTKDSSGLLELENRSRIVSLAGTARAVRGWSADLLIIDEAAFVEEPTFAAARATTIATGGRTIVQSTPGNPVGAFYDMWMAPMDGWARIHVRSDEASTISPEDLARFKAEMKPEEFAQEYEAVFASAADFGATVFHPDDVERAFSAGVGIPSILNDSPRR